ncbi:MAG TPA: hypothetical protein VIX12_06550 [Candidatus Binataceae bacterium]
MRTIRRLKFSAGVARLGFVDVLTALALLGLLLYAAYLQMSVYKRSAPESSPTATLSKTP